MEPDDFKRKRVVLVVEDEVLLRYLIADHLREVGFNVLEAANAHDAMTLLESHLTVDLVFSDVNMPGDMDGQAFANWLRVFSPETPVILTSGAITPVFSSTRRARRFIPKPYDLLEVERQIREMLHWPPAADEVPP
jgi:CheY-like chemotaxis protein